jgi:hypothetical protein
MSTAQAVDETKLNEFMSRFVGDLGAAMSAALVVIGDRLGLYRAMADTSRPLDSARAGRPHTDPAVKTGNPRLPPRGAGNCAVGGNRAWAGNSGRRASHLPTLLRSQAVM